MNTITAQIMTFQRSDFLPIAELFAQQNQDRRFRCLHSHQGSVEATLGTMNQFYIDARGGG